MNAGWLFLEDREIWAKCKECGKWNKLREKSDIDIFRPSKEKSAKEICQNAEYRKELIIERVWFARKGMNKPEG
jgi:predicted ATP-dependent serine protease